MITAETDKVYQEFRGRLETVLLEDIDYKGPMSAADLGLEDDLLTSLIKIVFDVLQNCLGAQVKTEELAVRVHNIKVIQQMHINNRIRKQIFKGDWDRFRDLKGGMLSDGLILTMQKGTEQETRALIVYVREGSTGLTKYPEL